MYVDGSFELENQQERNFRSVARWGAEPCVERVVDGIPSRMDIARIKAIGNAVVPQIPEFIGRAILDAININTSNR